MTDDNELENILNQDKQSEDKEENLRIFLKSIEKQLGPVTTNYTGGKPTLLFVPNTHGCMRDPKSPKNNPSYLAMDHKNVPYIELLRNWVGLSLVGVEGESGIITRDYLEEGIRQGQADRSLEPESEKIVAIRNLDDLERYYPILNYAFKNVGITIFGVEDDEIHTKIGGVKEAHDQLEDIMELVIFKCTEDFKQQGVVGEPTKINRIFGVVIKKLLEGLYHQSRGITATQYGSEVPQFLIGCNPRFELGEDGEMYYKGGWKFYDKIKEMYYGILKDTRSDIAVDKAYEACKQFEADHILVIYGARHIERMEERARAKNIEFVTLPHVTKIEM